MVFDLRARIFESEVGERADLSPGSSDVLAEQSRSKLSLSTSGTRHYQYPNTPYALRPCRRSQGRGSRIVYARSGSVARRHGGRANLVPAFRARLRGGDTGSKLLISILN